MKNQFWSLSLLSVLFSSVFFTPVYSAEPSPVVITLSDGGEEENPKVSLTPEVKDFTSLECNLPARITYTQGKAYEVVISLPKNISELVYAKVDNKGVLEIGVDNGDKKDWKIIKNIRISVTSPTLERVEINGAGVLDMPQQTELQSLQVELNGASKVSLAELKCKNFDLEINGAGKASGNVVVSEVMKVKGNGAGKADFKGKAKSVIIKGSGACVYDLDVQSDNVQISLAGTCKVSLNVDTDDLKISASGINKVEVTGEAKHHSLSASGFSKINTEGLKTK